MGWGGAGWVFFVHNVFFMKLLHHKLCEIKFASKQGSKVGQGNRVKSRTGWGGGGSSLSIRLCSFLPMAFLPMSFLPMAFLPMGFLPTIH